MRTIYFICWLCCAQVAFAQQDYYIKFPDDVYWADCPAQPFDFGQPQLFNTNGGTITVSYTDELITVVPDACYKIIRDWYIKSNPYDPQQPCIYVPNPNPNALANHPGNLPGPVVSPAGTPAPWAPTVVKVAPNDPDSTDYSTFWSATANCYHYTQTIRVIDTERPDVVNCPTSTIVIEDLTPNDPQLWNELYWADPFLGNTNRSEAPAPLSIEATDNCSGANLSARYLLFLDMDADGIMETVINSANPPAAGQVNYNSGFTPNYTGGIPRNFDEHPVPPDGKYQFGVYSSVNGIYRTFHAGWHTALAPGDWIPAQLPAGQHKIRWFVEDGCGNEKVCEFTFAILPSSVSVHTLLGKVREDTDHDCQADPTEGALSGWLAKLEHLDAVGIPTSVQYRSPDIYNQYAFLVDSGDYHLTVLPPNEYWGGCPPDASFQIHSVGDSSALDFPLQREIFCPFLETDIGTWGLRRCFDNPYTVRYCNTGTAPANNAFVRVTLDPYMSFVSASLAGVEESTGVWRFNLGTVMPGDCGSFPVVLHLDCNNTVIGQTHCVEAHIYPDSFCLPLPGWSGATVDVAGVCQPDSVHFVIRNTGAGASSLLDYIVIEDNIINFQSSFQLPAGDSVVVSVPANGSTWRLEAEQEPGSPGDPMPSATLEACGQNGSGTFSIGYVPQFGEADNDPFVSVDCQQSRGSLDPNDKLASPAGFGPEHRILPGQPLEYLIRFQNTGTDTAFHVAVRDTLDPWLDPASVVVGTSSHPCRSEISGAGVLAFSFDHILLPDSNVNEAASHGFVKFRVSQRAGIPLGTVLRNQAAIYFDFNAPVITPTVQHLIATGFVPTGTHEGGIAYPVIGVSPNPVGGNAVLQLQCAPLGAGRFDLFDAQGRLRLQRLVSGNRVRLDCAGLAAGLYYFNVVESGKILGVGKVAVN